MSTEIANSFTSKDLAETFPRHIASLEYLLHETSFNQSLPVSDSDIVVVNNKANLNIHVGSDLSRENATGPIGHEDDPFTQLLGITPMGTTSSNYSTSYNGMIPPTGFVFGDPLPWTVPSDGIVFVDKKDIDDDADSQSFFQYRLNLYADSELLLTAQELGIELQFLPEDIFPAVEPFYV